MRVDKTLTDRPLRGEWLRLRELGIRYDRLERESARAKNRIHKLLVPLFGALSFKNDWLFDGDASAAVCELYGFDAAAIVEAGRDSFRSKLRRRGVYRSTIQRLWEDAQRSATAGVDRDWLAMLAEDLRELFEDLARTRARRQDVRERMLALVDTLRERGEVRLVARPDLIGAFSLARILAETGPMRDFADIRQLWRYGGLNLCPRQSGKKRGKDRQSKRGRARLRHVVSLAVFKRVVKGALYGDYYHAKRKGGMCSGKAMTAVARKFLKLLWGLDGARSAQMAQPRARARGEASGCPPRGRRAEQSSGAEFDPRRVFASEGAVVDAA
ncbi:hypothetical protein ASA1KI_03480 [Opitutales bacterium ASA1]|nr:hypothetical protein ASA1KI_03480 [Opitutales bacterium ASA1]